MQLPDGNAVLRAKQPVSDLESCRTGIDRGNSSCWPYSQPHIMSAVQPYVKLMLTWDWRKSAARSQWQWSGALERQFVRAVKTGRLWLSAAISRSALHANTVVTRASAAACAH